MKTGWNGDKREEEWKKREEGRKGEERCTRQSLEMF